MATIPFYIAANVAGWVWPGPAYITLGIIQLFGIILLLTMNRVLEMRTAEVVLKHAIMLDRQTRLFEKEKTDARNENISQ